MSDPKIDIAVIDDGINEKVYNIGSLKHNIEITSDLHVNRRKNYNKSVPSHGTTCSAIIKKYAPSACLSSIKILNENKKGEPYQLIKALNWCAENNIKLINLSLGSINSGDFAKIRDCINKVVKEGLVIVAACNNNDVYTVPASLTNVIGVKCETMLSNDQHKFFPYALDGIDILASGKHVLMNSSGSLSYTRKSNSFSAPLITAKVYSLLLNNPNLSLNDIKKGLYKTAINYKVNDYYNPYICINTDWVVNCIEYDKTMYCKNKFNQLDTILLDNKNKNIGPSLKKIFQNFNSRGKNVIYISDSKMRKKDYNFFLRHAKVKLWYKEFYKNWLKGNLPKRIIAIDIPIIILYKNSREDLSYKLSSLFLDDGYNSIILSTECKDILYGCKYLPESAMLKEFLSFIYKKHNCDIFLIKITNRKDFELIRRNIKYDIEIYILENTDTDKIDNYNNHDFITLRVNTDTSDEHIFSIYKKIKHLLGANTSDD